MNHLFNLFLHLTGSDNTSGVFYGFWSGFGSDIGELGIIGGLVAMYRKNNCHVKWCWRFSHMRVEGTHFKTCHKHSTASHHALLRQIHAEKYPEQHKFLNGGTR